MPDRVRDWMSSPVIVIDPDCSVSYALKLMRRRNIHSIIIHLDELPGQYGILTTTDVRDKIISDNRNTAETSVRDVMSSPVITANPEWSLQECSRSMHKHNFHHMPVADEQGTLVGMISATDLFIAAEEIGWQP